MKQNIEGERASLLHDVMGIILNKEHLAQDMQRPQLIIILLFSHTNYEKCLGNRVLLNR
jgi:hypothetical protein